MLVFVIFTTVQVKLVGCRALLLLYFALLLADPFMVEPQRKNNLLDRRHLGGG